MGLDTDISVFKNPKGLKKKDVDNTNTFDINVGDDIDCCYWRKNRELTSIVNKTIRDYNNLKRPYLAEGNWFIDEPLLDLILKNLEEIGGDNLSKEISEIKALRDNSWKPGTIMVYNFCC